MDAVANGFVLWTASEPLYLNNQITTLLSQLGLPDSSFFTLYSNEIKPLIFAFFDPAEAKNAIKQSQHLNQLLDNCPDLMNEPFVIDILKELLREKIGEHLPYVMIYHVFVSRIDVRE